MPAHAWEIEEAEEEGIRVKNSWGPRRIIGDGGKVSAIEFKKCTAVYDAEHKFSPTYDECTIIKIDCDTVIMAIGQEVDFSFTTEGGAIKKGRGGTVAADAVTLATGEPGVFAGGDGVTGPKSAVEAIQQGHEAAISIERFMAGADLARGRQKPREEPAPTPDGEFEKKPRVEPRKISLERRLTSFDEIEIGYTEAEAKLETSRCLNCGLCSECLQCVAACKADAIDHTQKPEELDISVGSIILATGIEPVSPHIKEEYGYGRMPNVLTSLEFERILSASGPTQGMVTRPSDGQHPARIAWIQCVGSRDESCGKGYCSSVCCMYATKEAIIAKEHDTGIKPTIFYNDLRAFGKGFERYYESAKNNSGIRYIKSIPSAVKELQQSHNLLLEYVGDDGRKVQEEFDMVVLSLGLQPSASSLALAARLGIDLDEYGFCKTGEFQPNITSRPGIYAAGAFETPMDIPESVMSGSSAACLASQGISAARRTLLKEKVYPPEIELDGDAPRVGVFVCRCGANIARVVDVPGVVEYAKSLPGVVHVEENIYTCSTDTQNKIMEVIKEKNLNRVVVASCSPRTHESLFQDTIREAGLNKYLFEMANIRDQCSWVHFSSNGLASEKARDLVRMSVARACTLRPLQQSSTELTHRALVVGGGLSGMTAALSLAAQGFESVLVEKENELGGNLRHMYYSEEGADIQAMLAALVSDVDKEPKITVYKGAELKKVSGYQGNYEAEIVKADGQAETVKHGVVIMATGGVEYRPEEYLYGKSAAVLTQRELEEMIAFRRHGGLKSVAMIQCVGSREGENMYCSRVCCNEAVKNAIRLKTDNPDTEVAILYRDIRTYGKHEKQYRQAREMGVSFIRYDVARKPDVAETDGKLAVRVFDTMLGTEIVLEPDILVLSAAIRPQPDAQEFASRLKLPLTQDKFYMEAHMKLRPLDFASEGMYLCGLAHSPKSVAESIMQARGAVSRALTILSQPYLVASGVISVVDPERCVACLTCVRSCPYKVPSINGDGVAHIEPAACQGCGICASACPRKAIKLRHYEDEQVLAKTAALIG